MIESLCAAAGMKGLNFHLAAASASRCRESEISFLLLPRTRKLPGGTQQVRDDFSGRPLSGGLHNLIKRGWPHYWYRQVYG